MTGTIPHKVLCWGAAPVARGLSPWDQPFSATTTLLRRHPADEDWRRDRQPRDAVENRREQVPRDRHLSQLKRHVMCVPRHLGPNLDQLLPQRRQRPVPYRFRQGQPPQEVAQVVGESVELLSAEPRRLES